MAMAETLSPSSEGRRVLLSSNSDVNIDNTSEGVEFRKPAAEQVDFTSAPEIGELEDNARCYQPNGKQGRARRRKRRNSFTEHQNAGAACHNQNGKRRRGSGNHHKRATNVSRRIILPTKFLLGGNINDPLNLNSMMDENVNRALNAVTPSSSPLPPRNSTIDIVTPSDVTDPLGLNSTNNAPPTIPTEVPKQKGKRKRRRKSYITKPPDNQPNSDATSNSDDQKAAVGEQMSTVSSQETSGAVAEGTKKVSTHHKAKKYSPVKAVGHLTVPSSQANIKDPIVSPAIPQDTRRFRNAFGPKHRRRKHSNMKPLMSDAGIQTNSAEILLEEKLRCGSEKIPDRNFISPVKRRRTVSENLTPASYWDKDHIDKVNITAIFKSSTKDSSTDDASSLFSKPIGSRFEGLVRSTESGKSPMQNYMNKEMKCTGGKERALPADGKEQKEDPKDQSNTDRRVNQPQTTNKNSKPTNKKPYLAKFQYGNYNKYYGYRNPEKFKDVRMDCLKKEWFKDKDVLDIGCNAGHLTLLIARDYQPRKIVGVDIDDNLIRIARNNIRHYASAEKSVSKFPASMAISLGPLACPPVETGKDETTAAFPNNVNFFQGNYVPQKEEFLRFQEPEYDVITCMSVSKWVHLNWGDDGLIRMFRRVFKQLRAGGMFVLEPQQWKSYAKKKKLSEKLSENYRAIKLLPKSFPDFLTNEIGFERVEHLILQDKNKSTGFQRPIQVYHKPE